MKALLFLFMPVLLFSCKREAREEGNLDGTWVMVSVVENSTNRLHTRPSDLKDVVIRFQRTAPSGGTISGDTPSNTIYASSYTASADRELSIPALNMTKVAENTWGRLFVDDISAAERYHFEGGSLWITTANRKLAFRRP